MIMDQQKFWRQFFSRYVKGKSQPAENKILDRFFEQQHADSEGIWNNLKESPEQIRQRMLKQVRQAIRPSFSKHFFRLSLGKGIAATVLILLGLGYLFFAKEESDSADAPLAEVEWRSFQTQAGEQKQIILPDGSKVQLNYQSNIRFEKSHFTDQERKVYLEGEAFFEVQRDEQHPFIVETEHLTTRVLGTSFNVRTQDEHAAVAVASGEVEVSASLRGQKKKVRLKPDQGASLDQQRKELVFYSQISEETFLWREGILAFKALPMKEVIASLERAYGVSIQCDSSLLNRSVTARYHNQPIRYVLADLCFLLGATYEINANKNISVTSQ